MKAGVFYGKGDLRIEERPVPEVGPGQMLVKIAYVGICGTDVEFYKSGMCPPFTKLPLILGHENCGVVYKVGEGVTKFKVGDRVLCGPPPRPLCGGLPFLPEGHDQHLPPRLPPHRGSGAV